MNSHEISDKPDLPTKPEWMTQSWAIDHKIQRFFPHPYSWKEQLKWFLTHIFGPSKRYKKRTTFILKKTKLNEITPRFKIGFVGDIMKMYGYSLEFHELIFDFFEEVELLAGNLEGIITLQPAFVTAQRHNIEIIEQLKTIKKLEQWLLCLSNNHSGDFGFADFIFHLNRLHWEGFKIFGRKDIPNFLYKECLNFVSGTMWLNQKRTSFVTQYDEVDDYYIENPKVFNILFPHWHYEYELFPRPSIIEDCQKALEGWDLIVGHHPHVAQPITKYKIKGIEKLIAYSMGNFCSGLDRKAHEYGIIMKCEIGPLKLNPEVFAVGSINWQFIRSENEITVKFKNFMPKIDDAPPKTVKIVDKNRFFKEISVLD
ncbi:MAG: CapA family protein [Promethearchaeota archaeon]